MRRRAFPLAALAALALPGPVQAQAPEVANAEQSLQCAMWASYYVATYEGEEEAIVFLHALNYFVGRFEGLTGQGIDTVTDEKLILDTAEAIDALTPQCTAWMVAYGERMVDWGRILDKIGETAPAETAPTS